MPSREELLAEARRLELLREAEALEKRPREKSFLQTVSDYSKALTPKIPVIDPALDYMQDVIATAGRGSDAFQKARKETLGERERIRQEYPVSSFAGDITGGLMIPGATSVSVAKGAGALAKAAAGTANIASRLGYGAVQAAGEAALTEKSPEEAVQTSLAFGAPLEALGVIGKGIRKVAGPTFFGVTEELEKRYRQRAPQIKSSSAEQVREDILDPVQKLRGEVDIGRGMVKTAKQDAATESARAYDMAKEKAKKFLDSADPTPDDAMEVVDAAKQLRGAISKKSGEAFNVLQQQNVAFPIARIKAFTTQKINDLKIAGQELQIAKGTTDLLQLLRQDLDALPDNLQAEDMKKLVMTLDNVAEDIYERVASGAGYVSKSEKSLLEIRRFINDHLLEIPEYKNVMGEVAEKTKALQSFNDFFSNPVVAQRSMRAAAKDDTFQRRALSKFDEAAGTEFAQRNTSRYEGALQKEKSVWDEFEAGELERKGNIQKAEQNLRQAQERLSPVKNVSEANAEAFAKAAGSPNRPNIYRNEQLDYLDELAGRQTGSLKQSVQDLADKQAFEQGFTRGSRNVNLQSKSLGGIVGGAANLLQRGAGQVWEPLGGAVGAISGALADVMGPRVYQKILDLEMNPKFQRAAFALKEAAQKSPQSVLLTHYLLEKQDPEYRAYMGSE